MSKALPGTAKGQLLFATQSLLFPLHHYSCFIVYMFTMFTRFGFVFIFVEFYTLQKKKKKKKKKHTQRKSGVPQRKSKLSEDDLMQSFFRANMADVNGTRGLTSPAEG